MSLELLLIAILLLFLLRVPMAFAIIGPSILYLVTHDYSLGLAVRLVIGGINSWPLLAVPLFILVGIVATRTEMADRLYDFAVLLLGGLRAGLAYVNIGVSLGFSWMSGAALADAAGIGAIEVGHMRKKGYPAEFSVGLSASSALISPIMPPSIPAVVFASVALVSTGALFAAAIIPAILMTARAGDHGLDLGPQANGPRGRAARLGRYSACVRQGPASDGRPGADPWRHPRRLVHADRGSRHRRAVHALARPGLQDRSDAPDGPDISRHGIDHGSDHAHHRCLGAAELDPGARAGSPARGRGAPRVHRQSAGLPAPDQRPAADPGHDSSSRRPPC